MKTEVVLKLRMQMGKKIESMSLMKTEVVLKSQDLEMKRYWHKV